MCEMYGPIVHTPVAIIVVPVLYIFASKSYNCITIATDVLFTIWINVTKIIK